MHSPDGQWWWDGSAWQPAVSPDGLAWFDGTTWQPRGPARSSSRSVVIVIVTVTLALAGLAASIIFYARVSGEAHDVFAFDDDVVRGAAAAACLAVSQALDQAGPDRVRRIAVGNVAIGGLVDAMEALGETRLEEDRPAIDWIRDWEALAEARAEYSQVVVAGGDEAFVSPQTDDGYPITTRMVEVAPEQCERAVLLASQP